jgi:photosystem II stability/assembly factor-like uncharacterized protein
MRTEGGTALAISLLAGLQIFVTPLEAADYGTYWTTPNPSGADVLDLDVTIPVGIAVTADGAILVTNDIGESWSVLAQLGEDDALSAVEVLDSGVLLIAGADGVALRSADGGVSWDEVFGTWTGSVGDVTEVVPDLVSLVAENGVHVSIDHGLTWTHRSAVPSGLRDQAWSDAATALAGGDALWRTTDAGTNWTQVFADPVFAVSLDPSGEGIFSGDFDFENPFLPYAFVTDDGGLDWESVELPPETYRCSTVFALGGGEFLLATTTLYGSRGCVARVIDDGGVLSAVVETDRLSPWSRLTRAEDGALVASGVAGALLRSADGGASWTDVASAFDGATRPEVTSLVLTDGVGYAHASDRSTFLDDAARFLFSDDSGASWSERALPFPGSQGMVARASYVYVWGNDGAARSTDDSQSWTVESSPVVFHRVVLPRTGTAMYGILEGAVYRSDEDGSPWQLRTTGLPVGVEWWAIDFLNDANGFVAGRIDGVPQEVLVYATDDGGASWLHCGTIAVSSPLYLPRPRDIVWASPSIGFMGFPWVSSQDFFATTGLLRTEDGGKSWDWLTTDGILDLDADGGGRIHVLFDPNYNDVVWRSEDMGASWDVIPHGIQTWDYFLLEPYAWGPLSVAASPNRFLVAGGLGEICRFDREIVAVGGNPEETDGNLLVSVIRSVGQAFAVTVRNLEAGRVTAEVFDVHGRRITTLVDGPVTAGDLSLSWNGRLRTGRPAAPGAYFVQVRAGMSSAMTRVILVR